MDKGGNFVKQTINWRRGSASCLLIMAISILAVSMMYLYMTIVNIGYTQSIATTRGDAIADSAAVYAQSYDYKYNHAQAELMTSLLTQYNNNVSDFYNIETAISFGDGGTDDTIKESLTIKTKVSAPAFYPDLIGSDKIFAVSEATVSSVDIYGDILVVPPGQSYNQSHMDDMTIPPSTLPDDTTVIP